MTINRLGALVSLVLVCGIFSQPAFALRCGSKLVLEEMHIAEVIAICGEPSSESQRTAVVRRIIPYSSHGVRRYRKNAEGLYVSNGYGPVDQEVLIQELTYNFGPRKLMRLLVFHNGRLESIEQLGYGYRARK